ncbi:hypothetical protein ACHWQZ_G000735 [Mnemiopsis leidyi]
MPSSASKKTSGAESVKVVVRCRPLGHKEIDDGRKTCVDIDTTRGCIEVKHLTKPGNNKQFTFDSVFDQRSRQRDLYDSVFKPLVASVLEGYNGTIFAYGQTGTGKTYTMQGNPADPEQRGVIPNSFQQIFEHINQTKGIQYLVRASYLEIYQEEIRDLLSKDTKKRYELKETADSGVTVKDLSSFVVKSVKEIEHVMNVGNTNRATAYTDMNERSSRSHAIFITTIECCETMGTENHIRVGKLNMVDLAGSERQSKTNASGERFREATKINLSLSALGNVIHALVEENTNHIPYRDSKLTRLLQDSLGGNSRTVMVANIGPADYNYDETITTLRYANRAKNIKNKPKINEDPKDALLRQFQSEIQRLRKILESKTQGGGKVKRRVRRMSDTGEEEEFSEEETIGREEYIKEQQKQLEEEKKKISENQSLIAEEKQHLMGELDYRARQLNEEAKARDALKLKLQSMESKLINGGDVIEKTAIMEKELQEKQRKIAEEKRKADEMRHALKAKEEKAQEAKETFNNLQSEVSSKTKKLTKLFHKLQNAEQEIKDLQEAHRQEIEDLTQTLHDLQRHLVTKQLIINNFIPPCDQEMFYKRTQWDDPINNWKICRYESEELKEMVKRPLSAIPSQRHATCQVGKVQMLTAHAAEKPVVFLRYKHENILMVDLDLPSRTTRDYEGPTVAPHIKAALDAALEDEEELVVDAGKLNKRERRKKKRSSRMDNTLNKSSDHIFSRQKKEEELYPSARGLLGVTPKRTGF